MSGNKVMNGKMKGTVPCMDNNTGNRNLAFTFDDIQQNDTKVPRKVSFNKATGQLHVENATEQNPLSDEELLLAATLVKDAKSGRNLKFKTDEKSIRAYILFHHWAIQLTLTLCLWGNMLLAIFEEPAVSGLKLPYWGSMVIEILILGFFAFHFFHHLYFNLEGFWKDRKNIVVFVVILLTVFDMISYIIWINVSSDGEEEAVRWSRVLRPLFLVNFPEGRQIRKAFRNIRYTLLDIAAVMTLFLLSIGLFALMALKLFQKRELVYQDGKGYFTKYFESFWDLYVLVTTSNSPDVMMSAYNKSSWFVLFFLTYVMVNLYIFMSILLAVVYTNYKHHLKNEVRASVYHKRRLLGQVFDIVKVFHEGCYVITRDRWYALMAKVLPDKKLTQIDILMFVLDESGKNVIAKREFLTLADLLEVPLSEVRERMTFMEKKFPRFYMSAPSEWLKKIVRNKFFTKFFDFAILVNAFCIAFNVDTAEWFFLYLFSIEIILKIYTFGPVRFFRSGWNIFDFIVIYTALIATIYKMTLGSSDVEEEQTLDFILVFRVLRLVRVMIIVPKFQIILSSIVNIGPSIATYGKLIFVIFYIYAIMGMEIFGGKINFYGYTDLNSTTEWCGNPALEGSEFYARQYCKNNFNNLPQSLILLFELMFVNQWHVLTNGFVLVTNKAARLFFLSFHIIVVIILLNIFTAFVLEVFLLKYSLRHSKIEIAMEKKIKDLGLDGNPQVYQKTLDKVELVENDGNSEDPEQATENKDATEVACTKLPPGILDENLRIKFTIKKKTTQSIEVVLQQMFEGEIDPTDEGPNADLECYDFKQSTLFTLDSIA